ncbi:protease modulator HflC [Pontixanthobacter gangjinensis]|uniref:Protein HflC n=1 Tax=Pontixanthobacter gangjinensis TaxID=1028742 RepID=A0A6I4SIB5_9SPHN|nr:protease modulator HflC [Pontixanthobacter gangjinensis]MXO55313.1 protease modulator HflC [Pontixanthobacter gangjinensis]
MTNIWESHKLSIIAVGLALIGLMSSMVVIPEEEQAVVVRTGNPVRVINRFQPDVPFGETGAGVVLRIPLVEQVIRIDKRVLDLDMSQQQVLSSDQQRLLVDAYARFRIIDPVQMVESAGTTDGVRLQLEPILNSVLRQELGRRTFAAMLTAERGDAMSNITSKLDDQARRYGAQVIDVRIKQTDLPTGAPLAAAFTRMETDREREARTIRAQGQRDARIIRAEADAEAARIYAESFGKDPGFYDFYRAMQSYDKTFAQGEDQGESSIILSPDNEYLRQFRGRR